MSQHSKYIFIGSDNLSLRKEGFNIESPGHEADWIQGQLQLRRGAKPHGAVGFGRPVPGEGEGDAAPHRHLLPEGGPLPVAQVVDLSQLLQVLVMPPVVETSNITWTEKSSFINWRVYDSVYL